MAAWVYPPIPPDQLKLKEEESLVREVQWLLESLQESLGSVKEGLRECVALLAPEEPGSTLALSSLRSESVKGFVTRIGTRIVKGDINLRISSLAPNIPRGSPTYPSTRYTLGASTATSSNPDLTLPPLVELANHLNDSLDMIDITRWTGQSTSAPFISGQLRLLSDHLGSARACLQGPEVFSLAKAKDEWWLSSVPGSMCEPALNPNLSLHFGIRDASLVLTVRTLSPVNHQNNGNGNINNNSSNSNNNNNNNNNNQTSSTSSPAGNPFPFAQPSNRPATPPNPPDHHHHPPSSSSSNTFSSSSTLSGFKLRDRLSSLGLGIGIGIGIGIGAHRPPTHDEQGEVFPWRGGNGSGSGGGGGGGGGSGGGSGSGNVRANMNVCVREKVRVESADPILLSVAAKLSALEHEVGRLRLALSVVMGETDPEDEG